MARRRQEDENIRKLSRVGGGTSYSVTIPIEIIRELNWKETQKVVFALDKERQEIVIRDWKKK